MSTNQYVQRNSARLRFCAAVMATAATIVLPALSARPAGAQSGELTQVGAAVQLSSRLQELTLKTPALATPRGFIMGANPTGQTKVRVLLPDGYDPSGSRRYPVLYLFHGGSENEAAWTSPEKKGNAEQLTTGLPLIVVMPDGGTASGYADWYNNGNFGPPQWKTYHLEQLIPWIDSHYQTIADRSARATAGLSMGGGGLRYAAQRPDLIGVTASFSGDIDLTQPASGWHGMGAGISKLIWGDFATQEVRWRGVNGPDLAKNLSNTDVSIFAGDTDQTEGTFINGAAVAMHERLQALNIAHQYRIYPGMKHDWVNFNNELAGWLPHLMEQFGKPATAQSSFSFSTIAPNYSIFGWTVAMQRNALEFSALEVTDSRRFTMIGSGTATVEIPALVGPGVQFRVKLANDSKPERDNTALVDTDAGGHLSLSVPLGPPNPYQQFTADANAHATGPSSDVVPFRLLNNGSRFYRTEVIVSPTPNGVCRAVGIFTSDKSTNASLCTLMRRLGKSSGNKEAAAKIIRAYRAVIAKHTGESLTGKQAELLTAWADEL